MALTTREYDDAIWDLLAREQEEALAALDYLIELGLKQLASGEPMPQKRVQINLQPFSLE